MNVPLIRGSDYKTIKETLYQMLNASKEISKKLKVKMEFKEGIVEADHLLLMIDNVLNSLEESNHDQATIDVLETAKCDLLLIVDCINRMDLEEREFLYYSLVKDESEAKLCIRFAESRSTIWRKRKQLYQDLFECIYYETILN